MRWFAERGAQEKDSAESQVSPGSLYASGLIAAGGVFGLLAIILDLLQDPELGGRLPHGVVRLFRLPWPPKMFAFGERFLPHAAQAPGLGVVLFLLLAVSLFFMARTRLD